MEKVEKQKMGYSTLWKAVIRPPRCQYELKDMGPSQFVLGDKTIIRTDLEIKNHKGLTL